MTTIVASIVASLFHSLASTLVYKLFDVLTKLKETASKRFDGYNLVVPRNVNRRAENFLYEYVTEYLEEKGLLDFPHFEGIGYPRLQATTCEYGYTDHDFDTCLVPFRGKTLVVNYRCVDEPKKQVSNSNDSTTSKDSPGETNKYFIGVHRSTREKIVLFVKNLIMGSPKDADSDKQLLHEFADTCVKNHHRHDWYVNTIIQSSMNLQTHVDVDRPIVPLAPLNDRIFLNSDLKHNLLADVQEFMKSKDSYRRKRLIYMRTYLFYGPPGTGKTRMIREVCEEYGIKMMVIGNINSIPYSSRDIDEVMRAFVIEDVDLLINREDKNSVSQASKGKDNDKFSYNELLARFMKFLDGTLFTHNTIVFMTSNYPHLLDERLLRSGRVNYKLKMKGLTDKGEIRRLIRHELDLDLAEQGLRRPCNATNKEIDEAVDLFAEEGRTVSKIVAHCQNRHSVSNKTLCQIARESDAYDEKIKKKRVKSEKESPAKIAKPEIEALESPAMAEPFDLPSPKSLDKMLNEIDFAD